MDGPTYTECWNIEDLKGQFLGVAAYRPSKLLALYQVATFKDWKHVFEYAAIDPFAMWGGQRADALSCLERLQANRELLSLGKRLDPIAKNKWSENLSKANTATRTSTKTVGSKQACLK